MTQYNINQAISEIIENGFYLDEETGEFIDRAEALDALQMERKEKEENIALYIKNLDGLAAEIKAEEEALKKRREAREAKADRLREYLATTMTTAGEPGLETAKVCVTFRKSEAVIVDEEKLDKAFMKETVKITTAPDKVAIKKAIKAGQTVTGAYIEERKKVQIK